MKQNKQQIQPLIVVSNKSKPENSNNNNNNISEQQMKKIKEYMGMEWDIIWAWLSCLFCCCICGSFAICCSHKAKRDYSNENYTEARKYKRKAPDFIMFAIGFGVLLLPIRAIYIYNNIQNEQGGYPYDIAN